jgi:hypothetical protein
MLFGMCWLNAVEVPGKPTYGKRLSISHRIGHTFLYVKNEMSNNTQNQQEKKYTPL